VGQGKAVVPVGRQIVQQSEYLAVLLGQDVT